ncbi:hypothetical protein HK102_009786 [Quaeritorhiza haematococci]|nr:hypothetical protein HK102_009786 [Quaeritorhiza haematococci]
MAFNYDKWNKLEDYSSSEDEEDKRAKKMVAERAAASAKAVKRHGLLVTVFWDSYCEMIRWALALHEVSYFEEQTSVPVFENERKEVFKRTPTDILVWLFAHSFSGKVRIYTPQEALDMQQLFESKLLPAARTIFLHTVLSSPVLSRKYMIDPIHLNTHRSVARLTWPFLKWIMWYYFRLPTLITKKRKLDECWNTVEEVFRIVEGELDKTSDKGQKKYIMGGDSITAADISFACHAMYVLLPNHSQDTFAEKLGVNFPSLKELPDDVRLRVKSLRATPAGQFAIRLYRKDRGRNLDLIQVGKPSKHAKENNPWWAEYEKLFRIAYVGFGVVALLPVGVALFMPWYFTLGFLAALVSFAYAGVVKPLVVDSPEVWTLVKQVAFACFSNPDEVDGVQGKGEKKMGYANEEKGKGKESVVDKKDK